MRSRSCSYIDAAGSVGEADAGWLRVAVDLLPPAVAAAGCVSPWLCDQISLAAVGDGSISSDWFGIGRGVGDRAAERSEDPAPRSVTPTTTTARSSKGFAAAFTAEPFMCLPRMWSDGCGGRGGRVSGWRPRWRARASRPMMVVWSKRFSLMPQWQCSTHALWKRGSALYLGRWKRWSGR